MFSTENFHAPSPGDPRNQTVVRGAGELFKHSLFSVLVGYCSVSVLWDTVYTLLFVSPAYLVFFSHLRVIRPVLMMDELVTALKSFCHFCHCNFAHNVFF